MKQVHYERMERLCVFLDKLPFEKFDFGTVAKHSDETQCGTIGCAMGWAPAALPELVEWTKGEEQYYDSCAIRLVGSDEHWHDYDDIANRIFGFDCDGLFGVGYSLFTPDGQSCLHEELTDLDGHATPKEVAAMLRTFMRLVKEGKIQP